MIDPNVIRKIAAHCDVKIGSLGAFDLSQIEINAEGIHATVASYLQHVPDVPVYAESFSPRDLCRLCGQSDLVEQNEAYIPGCHILGSGYLSFGTEMSGDAFAVDIYDGMVYLVSHEISWDEEIYDDEDRGAENRQIIAEGSELIADSIPDFFNAWLSRLEEIANEERKFQSAAAINPNAVDADGSTQLILSVRSGNTRDVRKQIDSGVDIEYFGTTEHRNALGESVVFGHPEILQLLIDSGANVNAANKNGETALMLGAHYSQRECIEILLHSGADLSSTDCDNRTAYDRICVIHGTPEIETLLKNGA